MSEQIDYEQLAKNLAKETAKLGLRMCNTNKTMFDITKELLLEYREKEMPDWDTPFHYNAEGWASMKYFMQWLDNKSNDS